MLWYEIRLIVRFPSPTVAVMQWRNEIETHTNGMKVLVWHGASRVMDHNELKQYDVVRREDIPIISADLAF